MYRVSPPATRPAPPVANPRVAAYHALMDTHEDPETLHLRLNELRVEHRDLDEAIARIVATPGQNELMLRRLKKRKLLLKDRITFIESQLMPDELA